MLAVASSGELTIHFCDPTLSHGPRASCLFTSVFSMVTMKLVFFRQSGLLNGWDSDAECDSGQLSLKVMVFIVLGMILQALTLRLVSAIIKVRPAGRPLLSNFVLGVTC